MTNEPDHYAILGILPDAEQVVVIAAYRALASLYHPDRWKGDLTEATRRMADINVAYATLGDVAVNIFPDLADIRRRLSKTAHRLAFAFVTVMLDTRQFEN